MNDNKIKGMPFNYIIRHEMTCAFYQKYVRSTMDISKESHTSERGHKGNKDCRASSWTAPAFRTLAWFFLL